MTRFYTLTVCLLIGFRAFGQLGHPDDAQSRAQYEVERLADPSTGKIPDFMRQKELSFAATLPSDRITSRAQVSFSKRGPYYVGGRTRAFAIDVNDENRLLAGSPSGGMWLSTDGGSTWNMTTTNSQLKNVTCLAQDTRAGFTQNWYYGSGEAYGASASGGGAYFLGDGIFKSTDGGNTWNQLPSTSNGNPNNFSTGWQLVWNIVTDPSAALTEEVVYAALYGGIFRSNDGGNTWTNVLGASAYFTDVAVASDGVVYATLSDDGTPKGIFRSMDGVTFTDITPSAWPVDYDRIVIGINPSNEDEVYFLAHTPGHGKATYDWQGNPEYNSLYRYNYITGDGAGANGTWEDLSINLPNLPGQFDKWQVQGSYDMVVQVHPSNSGIVYIGGTNLYRSTSAFNDSLNTTMIGGYLPGSALPVIASYQNHHPDQHVIAFSPSDPDIMYSANDGGVFRTDDNQASTVSWISLNNGYLSTMFYTIAIDHATAGSDIITAGAQDNGTWWTNSSNILTPWTHPRGGDGSYCAIEDGAGVYYFSIQNGKMQRAVLDGAGSVTSYARIDPIGGEDYRFINPFILDPNDNNIMYLAGGKYLWRNDDLSGIPMVNNWDSISTNWVKWSDSIPQNFVYLSALHACKTPANRVYYGGTRRNIFRVDNANMGTPAPIDISAAVMPSTANTSCIVADPKDGDNVLVAFSNYNIYSIFYSTDAGANWEKCAGNLEQNATGTGNGPSVRWLEILPVSDGKVYLAGTSVGLFATDTLMGTNTQWVQMGANDIGNSVVDMIKVRESDGLVVIATHSNGVYSTYITSVEDIMSQVKENHTTAALRVYPNPAEDHLNLEVDGVRADNVEIWDECGRIVKRIDRIDAHSSVLDVTGLSAGLHYISVITESGRITKSFVKR